MGTLWDITDSDANLLISELVKFLINLDSKSTVEFPEILFQIKKLLYIIIFCSTKHN